jgi:glycosyltransferase involved in cell wall biosynthesis
LGIEINEIVFCFIGRIAIEKGILELIEVFEKLQVKYPVKLLLIGVFEKNYGVLGDEVKQIIYANSSIICPGRFDDVRPYYALSDIYVFPSYREGFPNSVMEAGAMGLPCIVSNINGCNEIVQHMVNGLIVEPKDTVSLLNAMELLIKDSDLREKLSRNARLYIESCFKNEVIWNELLKEYNSLINFLHDD